MRCRQLRKIFGTGRRLFTALDGLDLFVAPGEFLAIVGPSGCGKTTLLRILAGLERHTAGELYLRPEDPARPLTAMVFQEDSIFP